MDYYGSSLNLKNRQALGSALRPPFRFND